MSITDRYRAVFNTEDGQIVLADLLDMCNFFALVEPGADTLILRNFAMKILAKLGITDGMNIVGALMSVPYTDIYKENR